MTSAHSRAETASRALETELAAARQNQLRHPRCAASELLAHQPKEFGSRDIAEVLGPAKWTYLHLHVIRGSCWPISE